MSNNSNPANSTPTRPPNARADIIIIHSDTLSRSPRTSDGPFVTPNSIGGRGVVGISTSKFSGVSRMEEGDGIDIIVIVGIKIIKVYGGVDQGQGISDESVSSRGQSAVAVGII